MFIWWSDPYAGLTVGLLLLSCALVCCLVWSRFARRPGPGHLSRVLLISWTVVFLPWAYISAKVAPSFGAEQEAVVPETELISSQGQTTKLIDLKGQVVILDFWATWCAPCRASSPALSDLGTRFGTSGLRVVGISADEDETVWRRYLQQHGSRRFEVRDATGQLATNFHVDGRPTFFLLDRLGRVHYEQVGWTPFSYLVLRYRIGKLLADHRIAKR